MLYIHFVLILVLTAIQITRQNNKTDETNLDLLQRHQCRISAHPNRVAASAHPCNTHVHCMQQTEQKSYY
jgi:hypothetical protein